MKRLIRAVLDHPYMDLTVAGILALTSLFEAYRTIAEDLANLSLGAHHGVLIFGLVGVLRAIIELDEGLERATRR